VRTRKQIAELKQALRACFSSAIQLLAAAEKDNMSSKMLHYRLMRLYTFTNNAREARIGQLEVKLVF
jgi:hypothetical protein